MAQGSGPTHADIYWEVIIKASDILDCYLVPEYQGSVERFFRRFDMAGGLTLIVQQCAPYEDVLAESNTAEAWRIISELVSPAERPIVGKVFQGLMDDGADEKIVKIIHFLYHFGKKLSEGPAQ